VETWNFIGYIPAGFKKADLIRDILPLTTSG